MSQIVVTLTQGQYTVVSASDAAMVLCYKWQAAWAANTRSFYAMRTATRNGKKTTIRMHRAILMAKPGEFVDHKNHDTLDNRRENLRICTVSQNNMNKSVSSLSSSGAKGVTWSSKDKRWYASISYEGRRIYLGSYRNIPDAALAYAIAAERYYGEFSYNDHLCRVIDEMKEPTP